MSGTAFIAMGGNLGDVRETMQKGVSLLIATSSISEVICSGLYRTSPIGAQAGETFLNAVLSLQTTKTPEELLKLCHKIEYQLGRRRKIHWGPRTIDLDLIAFDDKIIRSAQLSLPHPASWYRRFVLDPFTEIAPDWQHPERNRTIANLQLRLLNRPLILDLSFCKRSFIDSAISILSDTFSERELCLIPEKETTTEEVTWRILEPGTPAWENSEVVSRLDLQDLPSPTADSLINVVRSAIESPQRIAELNPRG